MNIEWYRVLICVAQSASKAELLFTHLSATLISLLFSNLSIAHFSIEFLGFFFSYGWSVQEFPVHSRYKSFASFRHYTYLLTVCLGEGLSSWAWARSQGLNEIHLLRSSLSFSSKSLKAWSPSLIQEQLKYPLFLWAHLLKVLGCVSLSRLSSKISISVAIKFKLVVACGRRMGVVIGTGTWRSF